MSKKKIIVLEARGTIGGGQVITRDVCQALASDYDLSVMMPEGDTPLSHYLSSYDQIGYRHHELSRGNKSIADYFTFLLNFFHLFFALLRTLKSRSIDVLYVQHLSVLPIAVAAAAFRHVDVVAHVHVVYQDKIARWLVNRSLAAKSVKRIIGVSHYSLSQLSEKNIAKSTVIYNHVDLYRQTETKDSATPKVAIVGDVIRIKGHSLLIDALNSLQTDIECHVIGNIVDTQISEEIKAKKPDTIFTGMLSNVREYLITNNITAVIVPSTTSETFSLAMVEAWSVSIPTIATRDFGMKELVEKLLTQYADVMLFHKGDVSDLASHIKTLLSDADLRSSIATAARQVVQDNFSMEHFCQQVRAEVATILH